MHRFIHTITRASAWLVLPLVVLLFAQWPLREWVQAYSRQTNDVAQMVFALLASVSITAASQRGIHLSAHPVGMREGRWRRWATLLCVLPWALFMLWSGAQSVWQAVLGLEKFAETLTPGYFFIKMATLVLYLLVIVQAVAAAITPASAEASAEQGESPTL
jgi:TRAP-type mannitol/chloroaromatic compound transport system permease small subunit